MFFVEVVSSTAEETSQQPLKPPFKPPSSELNLRLRYGAICQTTSKFLVVAPGTNAGKCCSYTGRGELAIIAMLFAGNIVGVPSIVVLSSYELIK